jgi:hypothetical protein
LKRQARSKRWWGVRRMVSVAVYTQLRPRQRLLLLLLLCCRRRTCHGDRTIRQAHV